MPAALGLAVQWQPACQGLCDAGLGQLQQSSFGSVLVLGKWLLGACQCGLLYSTWSVKHPLVSQQLMWGGYGTNWVAVGRCGLGSVAQCFLQPGSAAHTQTGALCLMGGFVG